MSQLPAHTETEISPLELEGCLKDEHMDIRLIDVREEDEFAICKIVDAELVALSTFGEVADTAFGDDLDVPIVFYCHHGMRSLQATVFLRQKGYRSVWSMSGGIDAWSQEIDSTVPRY